MADEAKNKVVFELVTPTALAVSEDVDMVVVPGAEGDFGILSGHTPILTTIRPGVINMHTGGKITKSLFVEGGFAEANSEGCTVLAEGAMDIALISLEEAQARLIAAKEACINPVDAVTSDKELKVAEALLEAVGNTVT